MGEPDVEASDAGLPERRRPGSRTVDLSSSCRQIDERDPPVTLVNGPGTYAADPAGEGATNLVEFLDVPIE